MGGGAQEARAADVPPRLEPPGLDVLEELGAHPAEPACETLSQGFALLGATLCVQGLAATPGCWPCAGRSTQ
eukprot:6002749-Alexandrium_andersonii.AAC.1